MSTVEAVDIEGRLIQWIEQTTGVATYAEVPNPRPDEFVTVERTGGARTDVVVDNPMLAIQCWSTSREAASRLARSIDSVLPSFAYEPRIYKVNRNSLYNFPDEQGKNARYQIVVQIKTI